MREIRRWRALGHGGGGGRTAPQIVGRAARRDDHIAGQPRTEPGIARRVERFGDRGGVHPPGNGRGGAEQIGEVLSGCRGLDHRVVHQVVRGGAPDHRRQRHHRVLRRHQRAGGFQIPAHRLGPQPDCREQLLHPGGKLAGQRTGLVDQCGDHLVVRGVALEARLHRLQRQRRLGAHACRQSDHLHGDLGIHLVRHGGDPITPSPSSSLASPNSSAIIR